MKRRLLRSFFIALLLLFLGGWILSSQYICRFGYCSDDLRGVLCDISFGYTFVALQHPDEGVIGWSGELQHEQTSFWPSDQYGFKYWFLGFGFLPDDPSHRFDWAVAIPHWSVVLSSAVLLWLVWRKTRPTAKGGAFPVELAKPSGEP